MADTPNTMSQAEFEKLVKQWGLKIKQRAKGNLPPIKPRKKDDESKPLRGSISHSVRKIFGEIDRVGFGFEPQGIYVHYGVGRGYKRDGGKVEITRKPKRYTKKGEPYKGSEKDRTPG